MTRKLFDTFFWFGLFAAYAYWQIWHTDADSQGRYHEAVRILFFLSPIFLVIEVVRILRSERLKGK